jgi:hypothetical protein
MFSMWENVSGAIMLVNDHGRVILSPAQAESFLMGKMKQLQNQKPFRFQSSSQVTSISGTKIGSQRRQEVALSGTEMEVWFLRCDALCILGLPSVKWLGAGLQLPVAPPQGHAPSGSSVSFLVLVHLSRSSFPFVFTKPAR